MQIRSLRNVKIGKVRYKRAVDFPRLNQGKFGISAYNERRKIVTEWLEENCEGRYYLSYDIKFEKKQDALLFYIRFSS